MAKLNNTLGLDIGSRRIGVAIIKDQVAVARPLSTIEMNDSIISQLSDLCKEHEIKKIVAGLPRSLSGDDTEQTKKVRSFVKSLEDQLNIPVQFQDEAVTSVQATEALSAGKRSFKKGEVDATAAALILNDYLESIGR